MCEQVVLDEGENVVCQLRLSRRFSPPPGRGATTSVSGCFENLVFVVRRESRVTGGWVLFVARVPGRQSDREGVTRIGTLASWGGRRLCPPFPRYFCSSGDHSLKFMYDVVVSRVAEGSVWAPAVSCHRALKPLSS